MPTENTSPVQDALNKPKSYEIDGEKITSHDLDAIIKAEKYLASKKVMNNPFRAISGARISTQGPDR